MDYVDVLKEFENAGFINVSTIIEYDIVTGWASVTINGEKKFNYDDKDRQPFACSHRGC